MQKEYLIQFYKTINKLLCYFSFAGQYMWDQDTPDFMKNLVFLVILCYLNWYEGGGTE